MRISINSNYYESFKGGNDIREKLAGDFLGLNGATINPSREFELGNIDELLIVDDSKMSSSDVRLLASDLSNYKNSVAIIIKNITDKGIYINNFNGFPYVVIQK